MRSRAEIHGRFCSLYGRVADWLRLKDVDCICQGNNPEHEQTFLIDDRPMVLLEHWVAKHTNVWWRMACLVVTVGIGVLIGWTIWG